MSRLRSRLTFLIVLVILVLADGALALSDPAAGIVIYQGTVAEEQIRWDRDAEGFWQPVLPGGRPLLQTGKPLLVVQTLNLLVPIDVTIEAIEIAPLQTHQITLPGPVALGGMLSADTGAQIAVDRLEMTGTIYPTLWGEYNGNHVWRGFRLISVTVYPLRLHRPGNGPWTELEVLDRYEVRLRAGEASHVADFAQRRRLVPGERQGCEAILRKHLANPQNLRGYARADGDPVTEPTGGFQPARTPTLTGSAVTYLIITSESLASEFQVLADHYTAMGVPAVVATVEFIAAYYRHGADIQETMRLFIREAYEKWGTEFVLLGGDTDVLPPRYVTSTFYPPGGTTDVPVDLYFSCLDGNWNADGDYVFGEPFTHFLYPGDDVDLADEVFIGRAPVSTGAAAALFVNKVISYARTPTESGWTGRVAFACEVLFPQPWNLGDPVSLDGASFSEGIIDNYLTLCTTMEVTRMYENSPSYPSSVPLNRAALIDSLDTGHFGIVNQIGHGYFFNMHVGDANFTVGDADALTNNGHWFLLYAMNCASAAFDKACLLERFIQNPAGGAVVSIGSSRAAFPYTANDYQEVFFESLLCQEGVSVGEAISLSRLPFLGDTFNNTVHRWTFLVYSLLGDPALNIWTGVVVPAEVTAPGSLTAGAQNVTVAVQAAGAPVAGTRVCLAKTDDAYAYGVTSASGQVILPFTPTSAGDATLTVTGPNLALTQRVIPISVGTAYIAVTDLQVTDDGTAGSVGNGNGVAEAGETVALALVCQDTGGGGASGCTATLGTAALGLNVLDGNVTVGNVPPGGSLIAAESFLVAVDAQMPDGTSADLTVVVTDGSDHDYQTELRHTFVAPEVEPVGLSWSDAEYGDGDGIMDDGERITVTLILKNFGVGLANQLTGVLRTTDPQVTLHDTLVTFTGIDFLASDSGDGTFSLADANVSSDGWCWILLTDDYGRTIRHDFRLNPPSAPEGLEGITSFAPDVIMLRWLPVREDGVRGYHVYRGESAAGPFLRANVDLIDKVSYFRDDGLQLMTRYYYKISTVDSSLVEGLTSAILPQSTSPPEQDGFPLPFAVETSGHCAVGDVDGDGGLDIVLGADEIYVWRADGGELFDGDDNPQTHGPITDLAGDFQPAGICLAQVDGEPGLEIVASNGQGHEEIHLMRANGNALPGWPKSLASPGPSWNWATPAVGDVDGETGLEVVVNTQNGYTWVWHTDGTELRDGDGNSTTDGVFLIRPHPAGSTMWEYGICSPALHDLDGDGAEEIIFGTKYWNYDNFLHAYRYDGTEAAGFPYSLGLGVVLCSPAVADLNLDGVWEIIFQTQNNYLHVVQQDGSSYPGFPIPFVSNSGALPSTPSPAVGDLDQDGQLEIVALSTQSAEHVELYVLDTDIAGGTSGEPLPGWPVILPGSSEASPVVGDVDGDGVPDILHGIGGGHEESPDNLYAFHANGDLISGFPIGLGGPLRASQFICDLDRDGDVDVVNGGWDRLIHVWDLPASFDQTKVPWPTFSGHNFRDGVHRPVVPVDIPDSGPVATLLVPRPYPNPFNPSTTVKVYLRGTAGERVELEVGVYDLKGRRIRTLQDGPTATGWHTFTWDGRNQRGGPQASGVYFLRAHSGAETVLHKISLIK